MQDILAFLRGTESFGDNRPSNTTGVPLEDPNNQSARPNILDRGRPNEKSKNSAPQETVSLARGASPSHRDKIASDECRKPIIR